MKCGQQFPDLLGQFGTEYALKVPKPESVCCVEAIWMERPAKTYEVGCGTNAGCAAHAATMDPRIGTMNNRRVRIRRHLPLLAHHYGAASRSKGFRHPSESAPGRVVEMPVRDASQRGVTARRRAVGLTCTPFRA